MQSRSDFGLTLRIPINNEFDRGIVRRKIHKLENMSQSIFIRIKVFTEKDRQFLIEYENQKYMPLRTAPREKQAGLLRSKLSRLPYILKQSSISTRISIANIYIDSAGNFVYYLNPKEFDISPLEENTLLERMYMMEWETIISIVGTKKQPQSNMPIPHSPPPPNINPSTPKHVRQASMTKVLVQPRKIQINLTQSKKFFTSSNKPQPRSKEDFNTLKTIQFENILNMNQEYIHQFIDILCDQKPSTNPTDASSSRNTCSKSTRSY